MSERAHYPPGVPCWVDMLAPDPESSIHFYANLFGWQFSGPGAMPGTPLGKYFVARLRGRDVAGVASQPSQATPPPVAWNTHVSVANAQETCAKVERAGGSVVAAAFDASPAGRMAVIRDPAGATLCIWEAKDRKGAQLVNEPSAWAMSVLMTDDPAASKEFYGEVFGWTTQSFDSGEASVTLWRLPGYVGGEPRQPVPRDVIAVMASCDSASLQGGPPHWNVDFWIDDADRAAENAKSLGARVVVAPHDVPGFRQCVLADPQGAVFSLSRLAF